MTGRRGCSGLLEAKSRAEKQALDEAVHREAEFRMDRAFAALDDALARTVLPPEPPNVGDVDAWLVETRLRRT